MEKKFILNRPVLLTAEHKFKKFDCGNHVLNYHLKKYALVNQATGVSSCYVIDVDKTVIAYYCLSVGSINNSDAPGELIKGLPKYPVPIMLLAKLAVDKSYHGYGIGRGIMQEVFQRVLFLYKEYGCVALVVDAIDEDAKVFYSKFGFKTGFDNDLKLYIPVKNIISTLIDSRKN